MNMDIEISLQDPTFISFGYKPKELELEHN